MSGPAGSPNRSMWRTFFTLRWLALFGVLVLIIVVFARLGVWQMAVARDDAETQAYAERALLETEPIAELLQPYQSFPDEISLAPVLVTGEYDQAADAEFLIPDRRLDGQPGYWVVTRMQTDEGPWIAMVRGFVQDPAQVPQAPSGTVLADGVLAPGEAPATGQDYPAGQRGTLDLSALINEWPGDPYNAFVLVQTETPAGAEVASVDESDGSGIGPGAAMQRIPAPVIGGEVDWRNLGYAMQWWVFAAFAVFMYWKFLRDAHHAPAGRAGSTLGEPELSRAAPGLSSEQPSDVEPDGQNQEGRPREHV